MDKTYKTIDKIPQGIKDLLIEEYKENKNISDIQRKYEAKYKFSFNTIKRIVKPEWEKIYKKIQKKYNNKSEIQERKNKQNTEYCKTDKFKKYLANRFQDKYYNDPEFKERNRISFLKWYNSPKRKEYEQSEHGKLVKLRHVRKRRATRLKLIENYSLMDEQYTRELFDNKCAICGSKENIELDHWKPLSKGYPLTRKNSVLLCKHCNCHKAYKMPEEVFEVKIVKRINKILES